MSVIGVFVMPHPPVILPEVGKGEQNKIHLTTEAYLKAASQLAALSPNTIVLSSPHSVAYSDYFHISSGDGATGDLKKFGASQIKLSVDYDKELATKIVDFAKSKGLAAGFLGGSVGLDHGAIVPLSFVNKFYNDYKLVKLSLSGLSAAEHYRLGISVAEAAKALNKNVVFVASGDLSHNCAPEGPYGYCKQGELFDQIITKALTEADFYKFLEITAEDAEAAAECGLRSLIIMAGSLDGKSVEGGLLSYQNTFGVGYAVASYLPKGQDNNRCFLDNYLSAEDKRLAKVRKSEDAYVSLARASVESFVKSGKRAKLPDNLISELTEQRAGVFVSIKKDGALRGCIGTISPVKNSVAQEILYNAVSACSDDPRFEPVAQNELNQLVYSVDVLRKPEKVSRVQDLDAQRYGVIVTCGNRRGLLLPALKGVDTVESQISIALAKAGIKENETYTLERFEVVRHL